MNHVILTVATVVSLFVASDAYYILRNFRETAPRQNVLMGSGIPTRQYARSPRGNRPTMILLDQSAMNSGYTAFAPSSAPMPISDVPVAPVSISSLAGAVPVFPGQPPAILSKLPATQTVFVPVAAAHALATAPAPPAPAVAPKQTTQPPFNDFFSYMMADQMDYPMAFLASRHMGFNDAASTTGGNSGQDFFARYMMMDAMDFPSIF